MDEIKFENGSIIEPIGDAGQGMRGKRSENYISIKDEIQKELFIVTYKYKLKEDNEWDRDAILIKAKDNKYVHKYMDKFRQTFINHGYEMTYSFERVGEGNFVEV